ncbi:MAG: DUF3137 domain-containing protein [Maricaulis sp.]|jgi:hypothetical protein|nr:DUF3137 domain-containing protein [Maricaulis sp.]
MAAQFDDLWQDKLQPWLTARADEQRVAKQRFWTWMPMGTLIGFTLGGITSAMGGEPRLIVVLVLGCIAIGWAGGIEKLKSLKKKIKLELLTEIARTTGLKYALKPYLPTRYHRFLEHGIIPRHDRKHFEDHFEGEVHGCNFELYEAHFEKRVRSRRSTYWVTVFRGVMIRIGFPHNVEGVTVITRDKGFFNVFEAFGRKLKKKKLERIGLVDPKFERIFEVYGNDQMIARYMLTPSFMERLLALEKAIEGKNVRALFDEDSGSGELLIAAETGDQFEISSLFNPVPDKSKVMGVVDEIRLVTEIIDLLVEPAQFGEHGKTTT